MPFKSEHKECDLKEALENYDERAKRIREAFIKVCRGDFESSEISSIQRAFTDSMSIQGELLVMFAGKRLDPISIKTFFAMNRTEYNAFLDGMEKDAMKIDATFRDKYEEGNNVYEFSTQEKGKFDA